MKKSRYIKIKGQWYFKNYDCATKLITGVLGGKGLIKAFTYKCLKCGKECRRIKCHIKNPNKVFCNTKCSNGYNSPLSAKRGSESYGWKGGRRRSPLGYIYLYAPEHPKATHKCVLEHRYVMEKKIGRLLSDHETVHHKNGIRDDNRIQNLELWSTQHGKGGRVVDLVKYAIDILSKYRPELLIKNEKTSNCITRSCERVEKK